jgi:hypothetical protein
MMGYGLNGWGLFPEGIRDYLFHSVQTGSVAHPASYPVVTGGSFSVAKAAGSKIDCSHISNGDV